MEKIIQAKKAIPMMKSIRLKLLFKALVDPTKIKILYKINILVAIKTKDGLNPLCWQSKKVDRITCSSFAQEASAVCDSADLLI